VLAALFIVFVLKEHFRQKTSGDIRRHTIRVIENFIMERTGMLKITYVFFHYFIAYTLLKERRKSHL
jgi:hypothetical protein